MNIYSLLGRVEVLKMPNKDGTGPEGKGSLTGRQLGKCKGARTCPRGLERGQGFGRGLSRGQGMGRRISQE